MSAPATFTKRLQNDFEQAEETAKSEVRINQKDRLAERIPADRDPGRSNGNQTNCDQQKETTGGRGDNHGARAGFAHHDQH